MLDGKGGENQDYGEEYKVGRNIKLERVGSNWKEDRGVYICFCWQKIEFLVGWGKNMMIHEEKTEYKG